MNFHHSQSPIVRRARAAMHLLHIYLCYACVVLHHFQRAVTQQRLKREQITATAQIRNRESMAKTMRMAVLHLRSFAEAGNHLPQRIPVQRPGELTDEHGRFRILAILARGQVMPQRASSGLAQVNHPAPSHPSHRRSHHA